jgi:hypothetical protein
VLLICGAAQRRHLPGRDLQDLPPGAASRAKGCAPGIEVDLLDLSLLTSDYGRHIHPCKACVSTAMPLCHWPCSCYPNHALNQVNDWMGEIYERWAAAHGVLIVTPALVPGGQPAEADDGPAGVRRWRQPRSDQHRRQGARKAKALELAGLGLSAAPGGPRLRRGGAWRRGRHRRHAPRPERLAGLDGLIDAGPQARLDRYVGYYEPYATSHEVLDGDQPLQEEARNVGRAVAHTVQELRAGRLQQVRPKLERPRPK